MDFAIVICIFSLVGFESATALGGEARRPLRNVPRAVIWSLLITGAFMVFMSYVEVFATSQAGLDLGSLDDSAGHDRVGLQRRLLQGAGLPRRDGELLLAHALVPERGDADHVPDGSARLPAPADAQRARNEQDSARRDRRLRRGHSRRRLRPPRLRLELVDDLRRRRDAWPRSVSCSPTSRSPSPRPVYLRRIGELAPRQRAGRGRRVRLPARSDGRELLPGAAVADQPLPLHLPRLHACRGRLALRRRAPAAGHAARDRSQPRTHARGLGARDRAQRGAAPPSQPRPRRPPGEPCARLVSRSSMASSGTGAGWGLFGGRAPPRRTGRTDERASRETSIPAPPQRQGR